MKGSDPGSIVYIEESGVDNRLHRVYGRAKRGVKLVADIPGKSRSRMSRLGGWMQHQLVAPLIFKGGYHQAIVNTWLSKELLPQLPNKTTVMMDNAAFHKTSKTRDLIEAAGCSLLYLPTYSPDLNPIEHCWHTIKSWLRPRISQHIDLLSRYACTDLGDFPLNNCLAKAHRLYFLILLENAPPR